MVGFIRSVGTECQFVSLLTETEVKMRKTGNPFVGAVKRVTRNGLLNINYVMACRRNLAKEQGTEVKDTEYVAGETWYIHEKTDDGLPLALCIHKKDSAKFYLQYFPHRTIGQAEYFHNGRKLTVEEVAVLKTFVTESNREAFKPNVITLAIDSIRCLKARKVTMNNNTISKIVTRLAQFKNVPLNMDGTTSRELAKV